MQRKTIAALLVLMFAALAHGFQSAAKWVQYTSAEGHYSVLMPQSPQLSSQETAASTGEKFPQYLAQASDSDGLFMISYFDYPPGMIFTIDKGRDGMVEAVKGTLLSEEPIRLGAHPGREIKIAAKHNEIDLLIRARFYDVGARVYVIQHLFAKSSASTATEAKTARFFDSFKVTASK